MHLEDSICDLNLDQYASQIQAMLITPDWRTAENPEGKFTLDHLQQLTISKKLMKNGIIWLWSEKEYLSEIIQIMSKKSFVYIENVNVIQMSADRSAEFLNQEQRVIIDNQMNKQLDKLKKTNEGNNSGNTTAEEQTKEENKENVQQSKTNENGIQEWEDEIDLIQEQLQKDFNVKALDVLDEKDKKNCYFKQCRQIILMFRRLDKENKFLELRHQRTADVFFDMSNQSQGKISWKAREFIYNQIETLLPKAQLQYTEDGDVDQHFQMLELWGDYRMPRLGWITIAEKSSKINQGIQKKDEQKSKRGRKKKVQNPVQEEVAISIQQVNDQKKEEESKGENKKEQKKKKKVKKVQNKKIKKDDKL